MTWWMGWLLVWFGLIVLVVGMVAVISETQRHRAARARARRRSARGGTITELGRFGETRAGETRPPRRKVRGPQW